MRKTLLFTILLLGVFYAKASISADIVKQVEKCNQLKDKCISLLDKNQFGKPAPLKSAGAMVYLNRINSNNGGYIEMVYNTRGQLLSQVIYEYDFWTEVVALSRKYVFEYDAKGNETLAEEYEYDSEEQGLVIYSRTVNKYDAQNRVIETIEWEEDYDYEMFLPLSKTEHFYKSNTVTEMIASVYDHDSKTYMLGIKTVIETDGKDKLIAGSNYEYNFETSKWDLGFSITFEYDARGNGIKESYYMVDDESGDLVLFMYYENEFNSNNQETKETGYLRMFTGEPVKYSEYIYAYDQSKRLVQRDDYSSNTGSSVMYHAAQSRYVYKNNFLFEEIHSLPSSGTAGLVDQRKFQFTYKSDSKALDIARPVNAYSQFSDDEYFQYGRITGVKCYEIDSYGTNELILYREDTYVYSDNAGVSKQAVAQNEVVSVYPNPFSGSFFLDLKGALAAEFKIFNIAGQLVDKQQVTGSQQIIPNIGAAGVYYLQLERNGEVLSKIKIVSK